MSHFILDLSKYIVIELENGYILAHLRMTGKLYLSKKEINKKHLHVTLKTDTHYLLFEDTRRFGKLEFTKNLEQLEKKLGYEPFDPQLTLDIFIKIIKRRKNIKAILLDQSIIAGIGNIYADEILFAAKIHPETLGTQISFTKAQDILKLTREILAEAIKHKGTTVINFSYAEDKIGTFVNKLKVYKRTNKECFVCSNTIISKKIAGRTTHICPACQKN